MTRLGIVLAAAMLASSGLFSPGALAQGTGGAPNADPPPAPRQQASPPPAKPLVPSPGAEAQTEADPAPAAPGACPDTGRRLELIV